MIKKEDREFNMGVGESESFSGRVVQKDLFDLENPYVHVVPNLTARDTPERVRLKDLSEGNYRAAIVEGEKVVRSLGIVPRSKIFCTAELYNEFKIDDEERANLYLQKFDRL